MATNLAIVAVVGAMTWIVGLSAFILIRVPVLLLSAAAGVWLFYLQHQCEQT
jgi:omega-6 fatty acid desaturase (delta-12 desaturase)